MILILIVVGSCGSRSALSRLQGDLSRYPSYSVILQDMRQEGNFFRDYYHQYKIVYAEITSGKDTTFHEMVSDWEKVDKSTFQKYSNYLGMTVAAKGFDGQKINSAQPPGYQYVGDSRYGRWRSDSGGNSFWEFYGKFAFFNSMFHMFNRPVYRNDWNDYRSSRSRGRDYYGRNRQYGTNGSYTKKTNPTFFQRRQARERIRRQSFSDRVKKRVSRSNMSRTRSRSGGFGK